MPALCCPASPSFPPILPAMRQRWPAWPIGATAIRLWWRWTGPMGSGSTSPVRPISSAVKRIFSSICATAWAGSAIAAARLSPIRRVRHGPRRGFFRPAIASWHRARLATCACRRRLPAIWSASACGASPISIPCRAQPLPGASAFCPATGWIGRSAAAKSRFRRGYPPPSMSCARSWPSRSSMPTISLPFSSVC